MRRREDNDNGDDDDDTNIDLKKQEHWAQHTVQFVGVLRERYEVRNFLTSRKTITM